MSDLEFMKSPSNWPVWPYLPVKRGDDPELGIMIEENGFSGKAKPMVFLVGLYDITGSLKNYPKLEYPNLEAVVAAGWIVD